MKKFLVIACALIMGMSIGQAQVRQGETAVGGNLSYGSEIKSMGIGARFQYGVMDQLRGEVGLNYFFEKDHTSWWDVNLNAHWLVNVWNNQLNVYPLAGLNYSMTTKKYDSYTETTTNKIEEFDENGNLVIREETNTETYPAHKDEDNHIGLNVGGGVEYELNERWGVNLEYRHTIIRKVDQGVFSVGINYKF